MSYHISREGQKLGVFTEEEVIERLETGEILGTDELWTEGMDDWQPVYEVIEVDEDEEPEPKSNLPSENVLPSKAGVAEPAPVAEDDIEELDLAEEAVPLPDAPEVDLVPEVDEPKNVPQAFQAEPQASPAVVYVPVGPSIALGQYGVASAAIASVVLGILSVLALFVTGIPAILAGHLARNKIRRSGGAYSGDGLAVAGLIMGYVTTAVSILWIVLLLGGFSVPGSGALRAFNAERQVRSEGVELALVLKKYAAAHATRFPPSLKKLVEEKAIDSAKLAELQRTQLGPSWTGQPGWRYLGDGAPDSDANDRPLLVSHMADGGGHHLVIYHDATSDKVEIVGK